MDLKKLFFKRELRLIIILIIYLIVGLAIIEKYHYQINPDGISYISIAQKYLAGDFANAINGYWGPLLSWCLMPFLAFNSDALLMAKVLAMLTGGAGIIIL